MSCKSRTLPHSPFRRFKSSPEVIRLVVMMYVRFPLSLRNVEDLLFERGIDICHEIVRQWWGRFGPLFAGDIRRQRVNRMRGFRHWRWHLDEMYVKLNGEMVYLWRAVDHEGEILESFVTRTRDKAAALTFMKKTLKRHGSPEAIRTDGTVRIFVCGRAVEHYAAMALMKRSPNMTANWALAMDHSLGGIFHSFSDRFKIR